MPDVIFSSLTYDPEGTLALSFAQPSEGIEDRARRVERVQTLDGGIVFVDSGMAHGDRTLILRVRVTRTQADILKHLIDTYSELRCATRDGLYRVAMQTLTFTGSLAIAKLLVMSKEA